MSFKWICGILVVILGLPAILIVFWFYFSAQSYLSVEIVDGSSPGRTMEARIIPRASDGSLVREPFPQGLVPRFSSLRTLLSIHDLRVEAYGYEAVEMPMPSWGIDVRFFTGHGGGPAVLRFTKRVQVRMTPLPRATSYEISDLLKMLEPSSEYKINALRRLQQSGLRPRDAIPAIRKSLDLATDCTEHKLATELLKELIGEDAVTKELKELKKKRPGWTEECWRTAE